ncbi:alkaline phosphatase [Gracilaria domingensis]|nr:alkaline phosphatase [Gracilaria domingensis]
MRFIILSALAAVAAASAPNCLSTTDAVYTLPNTPLQDLNPWLGDDAYYGTLFSAGCPDNRSEGAVCFDKPAIGSGLAQLPSGQFLGLTDRGPNQDCEDLFELDPIRYAAAEAKKGKGFPLPAFAPTITHFEVADDATLKPVKYVPLKGKKTFITGLSNTERDDTPYGPDCEGDVLEYDASGLDTEDIAVIPGTHYVAIVDEYSPSVVMANYHTGEIVSRHVPQQLAAELSAADYPIVGDIPPVFANRRKNRGFEAIVVDKDAKYVIAILQSPMLGDDDQLTINNVIIRAAYFSVSISEYGVPTLAYEKSFVIEGSNPDAYENKKNEAKDLKYSGAQYYSENKFIALERAKGQVKLFLVDFADVTNIDDTKYADNLGLESDSNGEKTAAQLGVVAASKTLVWDSAPVVGGSVDFTGASKQEGFVVDVDDPTKVWMVNDNDFGLEGNGPVEMRKLSLGRSISGATVCGMPEHPPQPVIDVNPSKAIKLVNSQTYRIANEPDLGSAENFDVDEEAQRAYVANDNTGALDMYDLSVSPAVPMGSYAAGSPYKPTSTSVCKSGDFVAVAFANDDDEAAAGRIDVLSKDLELFRKIIEFSCFLPDHVKWSDDCKFLVAACEGEGATVPGGVLVADFGGLPTSGGRFRGVVTADFKSFDGLSAEMAENGVRLIESNTPSVDLEPEYVTIYGKNAFVTIQEANAIAVVDLYEAKVTELKPIGFIDRSRPGFALDASNKDDAINIKNYPFLYGMPQPDTIHNYVAADGNVYLVFANEGDAKDDAEEARGGDITDPEELNRTAVAGLKELVEDKTALGRLKFSTIMGYNASTNTQEKMFHFGSRSFSIMSLNGTIVFDSGEWFARIEEKHFPEIFNANGFDDEDLSASEADLFDDRSDDKGMEPESLALMSKDGKTYAFIGFERPSIISVFDITDPTAPIFVDAVQNHPINEPTDKVFAEMRQGDLDPEGLFASSKLNKLFVSGSVSSTLTSYDIE